MWMSRVLVIIILPMHLFLLYSIFDIYFTSPLTQNIPIVPVSHKPLAKRLILYVIDGLRANKLFSNSMEDVPYLRNLMMNGSSWGLSYTRVPTETRPGHVALIAGFYEDISSITKGWQENAVEFDSLFNRSSKTWSWGSPDVLPMFQKGAERDKVNIFCYDHKLEDFAGNRTWELDTWVFDSVEKFIGNVRTQSQLDKELRQDGVILFLHLLGIDVSGHSQKPHSKGYTENLKIVSKGIENMTALINNFYGDNETAFLVTSDHGMTDWGSHGDGSNDETITPVIAWGAGIYNSRRSDKIETSSPSTINRFPDFNIEPEMMKSLQSDIWQADLSPLMASLLGIPIPINSVGVVPIEYLEANDSVKTSIMRTNILQLFLQYETKYEMKRSSSIFHFQEYSELSMTKAYEELERCLRLSSNGKYQEAIKSYQSLSKLLLDGISYYHKYDRLWLGFLTSSTFVLWIVYLATFIVHIPESNMESSCKFKHCLILAGIFLTSVIYIYIEHQPYSFLLYQIIPSTLAWYLSIFRLPHLKCLFRLTRDNYLFLIGLVLLAESMVWSFFYRQVLSLGLVLTYLIILKNTYKCIGPRLRIRWTIVCATLMIFPNLPVIGGHSSYSLVAIGAFLNCVLTFHVFEYHQLIQWKGRPRSLMKKCLMVLIVFTSLHVLYCQMKIQSGEGLSHYSQMFNWMTFVCILPMIYCSSLHTTERFDLLQVAIVIIYNLMSIYYELLFLFCLTLFAMTWRDIELKYRSEHSSSSLIDRRKIVQTVIYIFILTYSFFATGNVASVSSFDVGSTYCFVTVFRPFVMSLILLVKIMLPMLIISLTYVFIQLHQNNNLYVSAYAPRLKDNKINIEEVCLATIVADFAALHFLFMIRDEGSWLEIGTSISNYVITMGISITAFMFTVLAKYLIRANPPKSELDTVKYK